MVSEHIAGWVRGTEVLFTYLVPNLIFYQQAETSLGKMEDSYLCSQT